MENRIYRLKILSKEKLEEHKIDGFIYEDKRFYATGVISSNNFQIYDSIELHIKAKDSNSLTTLTYGIQSNLETMTITPKTGELAWAPTEENLGYHTIQASVSDQFKDLGKDMKPITIFVYKNLIYSTFFYPDIINWMFKRCSSWT